MLRRSFWLMCAIASGCPKTEVQVSPVAVAASPDAGPRSMATLLDAWLQYHHQLAQVDGGLDALTAARLDRSLRARVGLSEDDVDRVEAVVGAVVAQRGIATLTGVEAIREFERASASLKPEQRQKVEAAFGDVRARAAQVASLDVERAAFGDEAVNAVLAKEREVTAVWEHLLEGQGERR